MKYLTIIGLLAITWQPAIAATIEYKCEMTKLDNHGWIAPEYYFQIDEDAGSARALSGHFDWTPAKLKKRKSSKYRMLWNVTLKTREGPNLRVKYQANMDTQNNDVTVRASFASVGASNKPFGTGTCKIATPGTQG